MLFLQEELSIMVSVLRLFNPDNDLALGNNNENYQSPASARKMAEDLAILPAWWAQSNDAVLVSSIDEAQKYESECGSLLSGINWFSIGQIPDFHCVEPWGWNPALRKQLRLWGLGEKQLPTIEGVNNIRNLSSRFSAVNLLPQLQLSDFFCGTSVYCKTEDEVECAVSAYPQTLLKAPYSSSGKGLRKGYGVYDPLLGNWCRRLLKSQGGVVVEPLYNRILDFAMEFYVKEDNVYFVGYSLFQTDSNGSYQGNILATDEEIEHILCAKIVREELYELKAILPRLLSAWLCGSGYQGYMGVDMMVCQFMDYPFYRIHPCVEINLRMNMGIVARLFYDRYVAIGRKGTFRVSYYEDNKTLLDNHLRFQMEYPLCILDKRIQTGYLSLVPVTSHAHYCAYVLVK